MKLTIDTEKQTLTVETTTETRDVSLFSAEAFSLISREWVRVGWALKYSYGFSWMGRPIIQLPEDILRIQEVIYRVRPDVIVETGVAHGGTVIFYASLCRAMGRGRVVGVDIEIRSHNREAIEGHALASLITLIEGSSTASEVVDRVRALIGQGERVLVILDSDHSYRHVAAELEAYADLVTPGSYIVATDGIMQDLYDVPGGRPEWRTDNPARAGRDFAAGRPDFVLEVPEPGFDEARTSERMTYWPSAYLRRTR